MRITKYLAVVLSLLCCGIAAADTRVELLGRVDFNGLQLGNCIAPPCPFVHAISRSPDGAPDLRSYTHGGEPDHGNGAGRGSAPTLSSEGERPDG